MSDVLDTTANLEALFDIEMVSRETSACEATAIFDRISCRKCKGTGKFIGYTGRVVGECFTCKGAGVVVADKPAESKAIDVSKIEVAFASAIENKIKRPKLRLGSFMFSRAPDTGVNAGSIYVKEGEAYLGKVTAGQFFATRACGAEREARVIEVAADPAKAAKAYGMRTGECSCCGRTLTNGISIDLGIGPICAEKYGWA